MSQAEKLMGVHGFRPSRLVLGLMVSIVGLAADKDPRLVQAAKSQNWNAVHSLLKQQIDVNTEWDGATALHWAVHWDDASSVDLLIRAGANVNAANELGVTPVALACSNADASMVEKLLAAGADPNLVQSNGESPLMTAARTGDVEAVKALLARGANVNAKETVRGQTALMWAVSREHTGVVNVLLEHGADVNARSKTFEQLVFRGQPSGGGRDAAQSTDKAQRGGSTALLFAARQGDLKSAEALLAAGANVNDTAPDGTCALLMASHSGQEQLALFLLEKGANPNNLDAGYTALHAAILRNQFELVKALLLHGADPNAKITKGTPVTREGQDFVLPTSLLGVTPFLLAAKLAESNIMRELAASGAKPGEAMTDGTTPLMLAAGVGWPTGSDRRGAATLDPPTAVDEKETLESVKVALNLGGDVNAANRAGERAIHGAAAKGFNSVVQLLADHGAMLEVKNRRGQTPLSITADPRPGGAYGPSSLRSTGDLLRKLGAKE